MTAWRVHIAGYQSDTARFSSSACRTRGSGRWSISLSGQDFMLKAGITCALEPTLFRVGLWTAVAEDILGVTERDAERLSPFPQRTW